MEDKDTNSNNRTFASTSAQGEKVGDIIELCGKVPPHRRAVPQSTTVIIALPPRVSGA